MKFGFKIIIVVCFLLNLISKGQTSLFFDKYYKIGYTNTQNNNVLMLEDSTYALLSYVKDSATGRQDLGLFKLDKFGNILTKKIINYFGFDYIRPGSSFNNFIHNSKASLISVAATYSGTNSVVIFTKIDKQNLDTIKTSLYSDGFFYNIGNLVKIRENKIFAIGNKGNSSLQWPVIFELDSNLVLKNTINCLNPSNVATYFATYDLFNKNLILGGSVTVGMNFYSFISRMDTSGNFLNTDINNDGVGNGLAQVIYSAYDNTYITIGNRKTSVYGTQNMYRPQIRKYNASTLTLLWEKTYAKSNMVNAIYDAVVNPDGSIVAVGRYSDSVNNPLTNLNCNGFLLKTRSNGDSLWMKEFDNLNNPNTTGPKWWEAFFGIEKTPEGGYIMCGNAQQMPLSEAWVVKTDSLGCDLSACMPAGIKENYFTYNSLIIYPNPVSNILHIESEQYFEAGTEIEIVNTLGQTILTLPYKNEIDVLQLSRGCYVIRITTTGKQQYHSKFIKE